MSPPALAELRDEAEAWAEARERAVAEALAGAAGAFMAAYGSFVQVGLAWGFSVFKPST